MYNNRRGRPKERAVPESNLNFVVDAPNPARWDAHLEGSNPPSKEQVVRAHFDRRQTKRDFIPSQVSCKLKYAVKWEKCISEPRAEPPKTRFDRMRCLRGYSLDQVTILDDDSDDRPSGSGDPVRFDGLVCQLKRYASELKTEEWVESAVFYPIGAKTIDKIYRKQLDINGRRWKLLVNDNNSSAFLIVESEPNQKERTIFETERALGLHFKKKEYEIISPPNCKYAMLFEYGEEPRLINSAKESPIALIFEAPRVDYRRPEAFYSDLLGYSVRLTRLMTDPEKRWLEDRLQLFDLRDKTIRILEFFSVDDRNSAMADGQVESLDVLFCNTVFSMKEPYEQLNLYIQYEFIPKHVECLAVTLANESDKSFAESAFISHYLSIHYFNDEGVADRELRYDPNKKTIVLQHFPRHMDSFAAKDWFIRRIAKENFIPIEKTEKFTERIKAAYGSWLKSKSKDKDISTRIELELYKIGHINHIYRPIDEPWLEEKQGSLGARLFLDVVKERPDVPWRVFRTNVGSVQQHENFTAHFRTVQIGMQFIDHALKKSYDLPIFAVDINDRQGPKLIPCYRLSFAISRAARRALKRKIHSLDSNLRKTFSSLSDNGDVIMEADEAWYYCGRVYEEWHNGSDIGIIGVMGWNPTLIRVFSGRLRKLLEPIEFSAETQPDLFYGIGEVYAKSLHDKYEGRVLVDVDKYTQKIRLIGDLAPEAKKDLEHYSRDKSSIMVQTEIPIFFPHFNNRLRDLLTQQKIGDIGKALGVSLAGNDQKQVLEFVGSVSAYEKLTLALGEISTEIFLRETRNREAGLPNMDCPTCMAPIGIAVDFYRFDCGHILCRRCVNSLIKTRVDDGQLVIPCLDSNCQRVISPKEIMHILFGDNARVRDFDNEKLQVLIQKTKNVIVNSNPDLKPCTTVDCPGILMKEEGEISKPKGCTACNRPYCRNCLADIHEGRTCADHERLRLPDESIKQWATEAGDKVKQCPHCSMMVEKRAGCNHMECIECRTHFCWVCLFSAPEAGAIYAHMTEEHGGHGGEYIDPANEDQGLQQALHAQYGRDQREIEREEEMLDRYFNGFAANDNDDDDDDMDIEEVDRLNLEFVEGLGLAGDAPTAEVRRRTDERIEEVRRGLIPNVPPHLAGRPPGLHLPPRPAQEPVPEPQPVRPRPAERLRQFPAILLQLDPVYYSDRNRMDGFLEWINNSETQEEQDQRIAELVQNARNGHH